MSGLLLSSGASQFNIQLKAPHSKLDSELRTRSSKSLLVRLKVFLLLVFDSHFPAPCSPLRGLSLLTATQGTPVSEGIHLVDPVLFHQHCPRGTALLPHHPCHHYFHSGQIQCNQTGRKFKCEFGAAGES